MLLEILAVLSGLALLVWSADRFVDGSAAVAAYFGIPPLLIGMVIVGFGTSAPEMVVTVTAALQGNPGIALGNAYGSNITNIALVLGLTALISPIAVRSEVLHKELPILTVVTGLAAWQLWDGTLSRLDALSLLGIFIALMVWSVHQGLRQRSDTLGSEIEQELTGCNMRVGQALSWLLLGLVFLILASRVLVWGAVGLARDLGISDLIIGLTIVAVGTSLPELASSVMAIHKGKHDIALGNVLGSNLFNTLAVVGMASAIQPMPVSREILYRDILVMGFLTLSLFVIGYGFRGQGRINRYEGFFLVAVFCGYMGWLVFSVLGN